MKYRNQCITIVISLYEAAKSNPTKQQMKDTIEKLKKRAEEMSGEDKEISIIQEGKDRIVITAPDTEDVDKMISSLSKEGRLEMREPDGVALISGGFEDLEDAEMLAATMRSGMLPIELKKAAD